MGRLDCKTPSLIALNGLARDADVFCTISEAEAMRAADLLADHGLPTTPSGAAGFAILLDGSRCLRMRGCSPSSAKAPRMGERSLIFPAQDYRHRIARLQAGMAEQGWTRCC